ncbi:hypothetical protein IAU59_005391 [Kwoniella sp. CBS 9459]
MTDRHFTSGNNNRSQAPGPPSPPHGPKDQSYGYGRQGHWRPPRFVPGPAYDHALAKERMMAPAFGGRSKKAQLGSIEESWGPLPKSSEEAARCEGYKGMFELEEDPPSRNVSPFREMAEIEFEKSLEEAWERARRGTEFDQSMVGEAPMPNAQPQHSVGYASEPYQDKDGECDENLARAGGGPSRYEQEHVVARGKPYIRNDERPDEDNGHHAYDHYDGWDYDHRQDDTRTGRVAAHDPPKSTSRGWTDDRGDNEAQQATHGATSLPALRRAAGLTFGLHHQHNQSEPIYDPDPSGKTSQAEDYRAWLRRSNGGMKKRDRWR